MFETEHICPSLLCCGIFLGISSLANTGTVNKRGSYLMIDQTAASIRGPLSSVITPCSNSESNRSQNLLIYFSHFLSIFLCPLFLFLPLQSLSNGHLSQEELYSANGTAFLLLANRDLFLSSSDFSALVIPAILCCLQQACLQFICSQIIWHFFLAFAG